MPLLRLQITRQAVDARIGARLGKDPAIGRCAPTHPILQRAIHAADGQGLVELAEEVGMAVGVAQEGHQQRRRDVVVVGQAATVRQAIVQRIEPHPFDETAHGFLRIAGTDMLAAGVLGTQAVEHGFGIEVVALLQHLVQDALSGSLVYSQSRGEAVARQFAESIEAVRHATDARSPEAFGKGVHEEVLRRIEVEGTRLPLGDVARHKDFVAVLHPAARHTEVAGRGCTSQS